MKQIRTGKSNISRVFLAYLRRRKSYMFLSLPSLNMRRQKFISSNNGLVTLCIRNANENCAAEIGSCLRFLVP